VVRQREVRLPRQRPPDHLPAEAAVVVSAAEARRHR